MSFRLALFGYVVTVLVVLITATVTLTSLAGEHADAMAKRLYLLTHQLQLDLKSEVRFNPHWSNRIRTQDVLSEPYRLALQHMAQSDDDGAGSGRWNDTHDLNIAVVSTDGKIMTSIGRGAVAGANAKSRMRKLESGVGRFGRSEDWFTVSTPGRFSLAVPLRDDSADPAAFLLVGAKRASYLAAQERMLTQALSGALPAIAIAVLLIAYSLRRARHRDEDANLKPTYVLLALLGLTQVVVAGWGFCVFLDDYARSVGGTARAVPQLIRAELGAIFRQNISLKQIADLDGSLQPFAEMHREFSDIRILDNSGRIVAHVFDENAQGGSDATFADLMMQRLVPATDREPRRHRATLTDRGRTVGQVHVTYDPRVLHRRVFELAMQSLTVLVVSLLFAAELLVLALHQPKTASSSQGQPGSGMYRRIRPATFIFVFGIDISMSFIPLHMERLYQPILGLSKDFILGLPISAEFLFVGLAILLAGAWIDRRGWWEPFMAGLIAACAGVFYSYAATTAWGFILARSAVGIGFGLALMAGQGFVIYNTDDELRAQGLAEFFAGLYSGSICGGAVGAILADHVDYETVFLIGGGVLVWSIFYVLAFLRDGGSKPQQQPVDKQTDSGTYEAVVAFLKDRKVLSVMLLSSLPAAIAVVGLLNYATPIYLHRIGATQTTIGLIMLVYGLSLVIFGPRISRGANTVARKRGAVFTEAVLGGLALVTFQVLDGVLAAFLAILLLGFSSCYVLASQTAYLLTFPVSERLGKGKSVSVFRSTSRIGQVAGPLLFAGLISATHMGEGIAYLGIAYLVISLLFLLTSRDKDAGRYRPVKTPSTARSAA